ncbi:MAG: DUF167 domain-containing protein [Brevinema sp.]
MFVLEIIVVPRFSRDKLIKEDARIKLKITAPPVDGQANKKIIDFLAKHFSVPKTSISLVFGEKSSKKKFLFSTLSEKQGIKLLEFLCQNS